MTGQNVLHHLVLVVEDDADIRNSIAAALKLLGLRVAEAGNGRAGLAAVAQERPHLILLDLEMPILDGAGFAQELRREGYDTPVIVMSAHPDAERIAGEIGAVGTITKPFGLDRLFSGITSVVEAGLPSWRGA
jgi:DNA-binding response OmpR family regulator